MTAARLLDPLASFFGGVPQFLVQRIVWVWRVVASPLPFWSQSAPIGHVGLRTGTGTGTELAGTIVPRLQSAMGAIIVLMTRSTGGEWCHPQRGRVLAGLGEQRSNAEIAARMYVSGADRRDARARRCTQAGREQPSRARTVGGAPLERRRWSTAPRSVRPGRSRSCSPMSRTRQRCGTATPRRCRRCWPATTPLCRDAITRREGHVFTATGDGFGATFASAPEAVAAAVDAQRTLGLESWPGELAIRVRMGLHSGTATERNGNYFGGTVNRAARITVIGRGGQILLSAATADLVADQGWAMVDLGRHRLKGLERPERIVRLDAPALPVVTLALRTGRELAGNLPHPSTTLIGRQDELNRLVDMVGRHRLVTVSGPGGAGKTRIALAAAAAVADEFPDGTWFVELGELQDPADVPSAVATTLALQSAGSEDTTSLFAALAGQRALLLLDNCEHLIDGVIQFVSTIESHCDRITVLATSREALGLGHEVRLNLPPLDVIGDGGTSDAVRMFCRACRGRPRQLPPVRHRRRRHRRDLQAARRSSPGDRVGHGPAVGDDGG